MSGIPPIVVGYDGSAAAQAALAWAAAEAARLRAPLRVVLVLQWPRQLAAMIPGPPIYPDDRAQRAGEELVRHAVATARRKLPAGSVTGRVTIGATVPDLVVESADALMMVLGHRGHGAFGGLLLGSVGVAVSAQAHCPVAIVRAEPNPAPGQVLVGFNGSACASRALGLAFLAAALRNTGVWVLHAWRPPVPRWGQPEENPDPWAGTFGDEPLDQLAIAEHVAVVDALQPYRRRYPAVPVAVDLVDDDAGHALVSASARAQLAVVGSCGHGSVRGLLFGSVSQRLVHHASCPVVVVHEQPQGEPSMMP